MNSLGTHLAVLIELAAAHTRRIPYLNFQLGFAVNT